MFAFLFIAANGFFLGTREKEKILEEKKSLPLYWKSRTTTIYSSSARNASGIKRALNLQDALEINILFMIAQILL